MTRPLKRITKNCEVCNKEFQGIPRQRYCSKPCRNKLKYPPYSNWTTEKQYERISGNWEKYLAKLIGYKKRKELSLEGILKILKRQEYKCALSGRLMTCKLEKGVKCLTNVSIDRIEAGGPYTANNIQLVCQVLNSWRSDVPVDEYINWCRHVVNHADRKEECHQVAPIISVTTEKSTSKRDNPVRKGLKTVPQGSRLVEPQLKLERFQRVLPRTLDIRKH